MPLDRVAYMQITKTFAPLAEMNTGALKLYVEKPKQTNIIQAMPEKAMVKPDTPSLPKLSNTLPSVAPSDWNLNAENFQALNGFIQQLK